MSEGESHFGNSAGGIEELRARLSRIPAALRMLDGAPRPEVGFDPRAVDRILLTGVGSSAGHARFLAEWLSRELGLHARFVSTGSFAAQSPETHKGDVRIVFSQGLSPNARFALRGSGAFAECVLVTGVVADAAMASGVQDRVKFLEEARDADVRIVPLHAPTEDGMLVRVLGPMLGYLAALRLGEAIARAAGAEEGPKRVGVELLCTAISKTEGHLSDVLGEEASLAGVLGGPLVLLTSGGYGEAVENLRTKVLEGMGLPLPPLWDLLEFSHGGFQNFYSQSGTAIALTRAGAPLEAGWMERARGMLDSGRHRWLELPASLPWPYCVFEHEAYFNSLMVRWLEERETNLWDWPGRGLDGPLYDLAPSSLTVSETDSQAEETVSSVFERMSWPEVERVIGKKNSVAVIPLGSTEQHGPHLPVATDTWIAESLAEGFCLQVPEAVRMPALSLGCAEEHLEFPGTLSLRPAHLESVLSDVLSSLAVQGFRCAFLFSAHGGNVGPLRSMAGKLQRASGAMQLICFLEWDALVEEIHRLAAQDGISAEAAGHHAGEFETSILRWIAPGAVRRDHVKPGLAVGAHDAQRIFYPSLRPHAPSGVVGDARDAEAERGRRYLECWVDRLVATYQRVRAAKVSEG